MAVSTDLILVGGGLASGLIALRLKEKRPELRFLILEQSNQLGGEHTWSFHTSDLNPEQLDWIRPLITRSWSTYQAHFPQYSRVLSGGYHSVTSRGSHQYLSQRLDGSVIFGEKAATLSPTEVVTEGGMRYQAGCVIDVRGFRGQPKMVAGYQKFLGLNLVLEEPHGESDPILMDGRVPQREGLRFFYTLPWSERVIQLGEARYTESPDVPREEFRAAIWNTRKNVDGRSQRSSAKRSECCQLRLVGSSRISYPRLTARSSPACRWREFALVFFTLPLVTHYPTPCASRRSWQRCRSSPVSGRFISRARKCAPSGSGVVTFVYSTA